MMKKIIKICLSICLVLSLGLVITNIKVKASNPFITKTVDRYGELVETQDAYESIIKYKNFDYLGGTYSLGNPSDIYIDNDDYLYICDTDNKNIVIINNNNELILTFGSDILYKPTGVFVRDNVIYVADYGKNDDNTTGKIAIYNYDKETNNVVLDKCLGTPTSRVLEKDGFVYRPEKISVDTNLTMYVVSEGSYNGILTISKENRFMSYFAPNDVKTSFKDRITNFLYGENEKVLLKDVLPTPACNVHIDDSGYIYTVTQTVTVNDLGDTLKKVNISGVNFYPAEMLASSEFVSAWSGSYGNVFAATKSGFIYEYDLEGNVLFIFAGNSTSIDQLGLFKSISGIAVNSNDLLYVLDKNDSSIQVFQPTEYAKTVHMALGLYNEGKYEESKGLWEEVLKYNSLLDIAHKGIGLAYYLSGSYEEALVEFKLANDKKDYSEAFWEIRNVWLTKHIGLIFGLICLIIVIVITLIILNKKLGIFNKVKEFFTNLKKHKWFNDFLLMFGMLRHPLDTTYYLKTRKDVSILYGVFGIIIIFLIYILGLTKTGFIFNNVVIEKTILFKEALKILIPIVLFIIANFLASSLLEGEGTFKSIFLTTVASLAPIVILYPIIILVSNILANNEAFIYYLGIFIMLAWSIVLLLVTNKELHNYSFGKMILNIIMTLLLMLILLIVVILVYLMVSQIVDFIKDIFSEVIFHD